MKCPVAYLITFTTYGTWLHGDKRRSVDKKHNQYGGTFVRPNSTLQSKERKALRNRPFILRQQKRQIVLKAILQVCSFRGWFAYAVHVRNNHIHIVVAGRQKPEKMMADFKAYATRAINNCANERTEFQRYWTRHGSTKYLWTKQSVVSAIKYVRDQQGDMMAYGTSNRAPNVSEG